jgi:hypothetical protein
MFSCFSLVVPCDWHSQGHDCTDSCCLLFCFCLWNWNSLYLHHIIVESFVQSCRCEFDRLVYTLMAEISAVSSTGAVQSWVVKQFFFL